MIYDSKLKQASTDRWVDHEVNNSILYIIVRMYYIHSIRMAGLLLKLTSLIHRDYTEFIHGAHARRIDDQPTLDACCFQWMATACIYDLPSSVLLYHSHGLYSFMPV